MKQQLQTHLHQIANIIGARPTGSTANKEMVRYIEKHLLDCGLTVTKQDLPCVDWHNTGTTLSIDGQSCPIYTSDYSLPCDVKAPYICIDTLEKLQAASLTNQVLVMYGDLCQEALMPKNFPWYNPEEHQVIIKTLEEKNPLALITVSFHDSLPIPIIEDGDFSIPCAVTSRAELPFLLAHQDKELALTIDCNRTSTTAHNIIAHYGEGSKKVALSVHLDTKHNTPGALDDGTGIATLLTLASTLKAFSTPYQIELVFFNGEDCYNCIGESTYVATFLSTPEDYAFALNIDGIGMKDSKNSYSFYECTPAFTQIVHSTNTFDSIEEIEPWPQGDHMLFAFGGIPTIAMTSSQIFNILENVIHTEHDTLAQVDIIALEDMLYFCQKLLQMEFVLW
ncbi:MAG: M28 family peptidase [Cellulosilyticum sp.]|nr:M28 family peptidase [Cellulosilyticum sp.]